MPIRVFRRYPASNMSLRLEMLQVARLAPKVLGDATELIGHFLREQLNEDGGFRDRTGRSDLYYTVFGLESLLALSPAPSPAETKFLSKVGSYLSGHGDGQTLDFVHLCCLARCWASAGTMGLASLPADRARGIATRLSGYRAADGGFHADRGADRGTAYGAFLGLGAYQDLGVALDDGDSLVEALRNSRTADGVWANDPRVAQGSTNATAAALTVLNNQGQCLPREAAEWLARRQHGEGGFKAMPQAPLPDLLSTATALHALSAYDWDMEPFREKHLDFVDSLWTNEGAFHGNWTDDDLDAEYTYYGLLTLGHLSV